MEAATAGMNFKFFRGDKVQQIGGGQVMTVYLLLTPHHEQEENRYGCKWFDGGGVPWEATFKESELKLVERPK